MPDSTPKKDLDTEGLLTLYGIESNLIQQKATHILAIRSIALTFMMLMAPYLSVVIKSAFRVTVVLLIPVFLAFYLLESVYDSYLIANSDRESELRELISMQLAANPEFSQLSKMYLLGASQANGSRGKNLLKRALTRPIRVAYYALLFLAYALVVALLSGLI